MKLTAKMFEGNHVFFQYYRDGSLWYVFRYSEDNPARITEFLFPVPISDTGTATFNAMDKAIIFMRWIRKHADAIKEAKAEN